MRLQSKFSPDIFFLMFLVMSGIFWQERIINQDSSVYSFNIISQGYFSLEHFRFPATLTQIIPILLSKIGLPLSIVLWSYSVSLVLIPYLLFRVTLYLFHDKDMAWAMFFAQILFMNEYFFDAVSESKTSFAYVLFLVALIRNKTAFSRLSHFWIIAVLTLILAVLSHPLALLMLAAVFAWLILTGRSKVTFILAGIAVLLTVIKSFVFPVSGYESGLIGQLFLPEAWQTIWENNYVVAFAKGHLNKVYFIGLLGMVFFTLWYARERNWKKLMVYVGMNIGLIFVLLIAFKKGENDMMMEKNLATLAITVLLPFISIKNEITPDIPLRARLLLPVFTLFIFYRINQSVPEYQLRQKQLKQIVNLAEFSGHNKVMIHKSDIKMPKINLWTLPYETALWSALRGPDETVTVKNIQSVDYWRGAHVKEDAFIGADFRMPFDASKFNKNYFILDKGSYFLLTPQK
jgi:hypothetical protein